MEALWEDATTTAQEENRKEEVLWVFRELARDSKREKEESLAVRPRVSQVHAKV